MTVLKLLQFICYFYILEQSLAANYGISCRNDKNQPVDWYIKYKIPDIEKSKNSLVKQGLGHLYMDASTIGQWVMSNVSINETKHALAYTLQQSYKFKSKSDVFRMLYNDEWPVGNSSMSKGHCKGVLTFDSSSGFWLIHSVPKFPPENSYSYPKSGTVYGQSMLCVSFAYSSLSDIASQLYYNQPSVYSSALPQQMAQQIPTLQNILDGKSQSKSPYNNKITLRSLNGNQFINFAKHKKWKKDLYFDFVAPSLRDSLLTETWQNGGGNLPSNCSGDFPVKNIEFVNLTSTVAFADNKDHSKWAVSSRSGSYICIGDINRQQGQLKRGGGTMCFKNSLVWSTFNSSVQTVQSCSVASADSSDNNDFVGDV